jgi:hypothetical protein
MNISRLSGLAWPYLLAAVVCALPVVIGVRQRLAHLDEFGDASDWRYLASGQNTFLILTLATLIFLVLAVSNFFRNRNQR